MTRLVLYVAHPLAPTSECMAPFTADDRAGAREAALQANLARAMRWLSWLRRSFPEVTFIAPWIAAVLSGEDDSDSAQREAGLVDADAVVPRCDGIVLCGGRISSGMMRERAVARRCWDLTDLGDQPPGRAVLGWLSWASELESRLDASASESQPQPDTAIDVVRRERDGLLAYIDAAKRAAGSERASGEPLDAFIRRLVTERGSARGAQ
jgi:hypothetical protein